VNASLAYAITIVAINLALIYPLYRRRIFLRL
jgi:heme exporter protein D